MVKKVKKAELSPMDITLANLKADMAMNIIAIIIDKYPIPEDKIRWSSFDKEVKLTIENVSISVYEWDFFDCEDAEKPVDVKKSVKSAKESGSDIIANITKHIMTEYPNLVTVWNKYDKMVYIDGEGITVCMRVVEK